MEATPVIARIFTPREATQLFSHLDQLEIEYHKPYLRFNKPVTTKSGDRCRVGIDSFAIVLFPTLFKPFMDVTSNGGGRARPRFQQDARPQRGGGRAGGGGGGGGGGRT